MSLYVCPCMCFWVHLWVHMCAYSCMYGHVYVWIYIYVDAKLCVCVFVFMKALESLRAYHSICISLWVRVFVYMRVNMYSVRGYCCDFTRVQAWMLVCVWTCVCVCVCVRARAYGRICVFCIYAYTRCMVYVCKYVFALTNMWMWICVCVRVCVRLRVSACVYMFTKVDVCL